MIHVLTMMAFADAVGPGPASCPAGSESTANHNGPYCAPQTCESTCPGGLECASAGLCVLEEERACGGMQEPGEPCTYTHREAQGTCTTQSDCTGGTTCEVATRCVSPPASGGCSTAGTWAPLVFGLGLLPLLYRRSRRA